MRYAVSDIYKNASCLSSWLHGTQYAVSDIHVYVRVQVVLIVGYALRLNNEECTILCLCYHGVPCSQRITASPF